MPVSVCGGIEQQSHFVIRIAPGGHCCLQFSSGTLIVVTSGACLSVSRLFGFRGLQDSISTLGYTGVQSCTMSCQGVVNYVVKFYDSLRHTTREP